MRIGKFLYFGDFVVIPIAVLWLGVAAYLGRRRCRGSRSGR